MVTTELLMQLVNARKYWHARLGTDIVMLNCSAPWDAPDFDPAAGEVCFLYVKDGKLRWVWQWSNGYDEQLEFASLNKFKTFYNKFLNDGADALPAS